MSAPARLRRPRSGAEPRPGTLFAAGAAPLATARSRLVRPKPV